MQNDGDIATTPTADLDGFPMHYERAGKGPALLMLPGALGTGAGDFHAQIQPFSRHFEVIAPDPRGYGRSRPPTRQFPPDFYRRDAADMLALMDALGHKRFSILGWSDGANAGTILAALHPERVERLVVFGGNSFLTGEEVSAFDAIRKVSSWSPRAAEAMRAVYGDELDELWERYVSGLKAIYAAGGDVYQSLLAQVRCPTLILHGAKDPLVPLLHPEGLHHGIAGSRLHIFPDGKHNIHVRYADDFNAIVMEFLTGQHPSP